MTDYSELSDEEREAVKAAMNECISWGWTEITVRRVPDDEPAFDVVAAAAAVVAEAWPRG